MFAFAMTALAVQAACASDEAASAIHAQRTAFNTAIAEADLDTIEAILAPDVILRAGTSSTLYAGREAQLGIWGGDFAAGEGRLVYVRTTDCVESSPLVEFALEHGHWRGERTSGGSDEFVAGRYTAKWTLQDGVWRLDAELFLTTACAGALCPDQ